MPKVVRFHEVGDADVLRVDDVPMPEAGEKEVVLAVEAFGLNRAEIMFRRGEYPQYAPELPSTLGYEAAGTVTAIGPGVTTVAVGDRVSTIPSFKMGRYFTYGEVARVPEHAAAHVPERLSAVEAAAVWMPYMTAFGGLLEYGRLERGEHVVVRAASSSVGVAAIQIARAIGAIPIAVTRGASKRAFVEAQEPAQVILSDQEPMADRILEATGGRGADMIFDPVAGPEVAELARALRYQGRLFVYGRLSTEPTPFPIGLGLAKGITIRGFSLFELVNFPEKFERVKRKVYEGLEAGLYRPAVDATTFPLARVVEAHRHMESNTQQGKIVVTVGRPEGL